MCSFSFGVCILNFGVYSVFEFLAYEGMNGSTNLAVVDLSPYGLVFKELALQSLILNYFLSFLFFGCFVLSVHFECWGVFSFRIFGV